ncbi:hypothetical protein OHB26_37820 [Nocardia sp. NBC_01503]|uniref:hypothetical protein n=1 Tax=Nocardia sp. NBC_01503 TaxID=2975997 RepID=UPI002E7BED63|nr:hypothetical protein [Nocardia sp. NBC_01503]WTL32543.1 hypothetical protein OHB26_37820 [Nocardia sp. NBC_01503]
MPVLLVLNELSCEQQLAVNEIDCAMRQFIDTLRAITPKAALVTPMKLPNIELAPGYPMNRWAADGRNRDLWRAIRARQNRAPYTFHELTPETPGDDDFQFGGRGALGLAIAHNHDGLAVSLPTHLDWDASHLPVRRLWIDEDADELVDDAVTVRHASTPEHTDFHADWLKTFDGDDAVESGLELWAQRGERFPALEFLPRVENHLTDLSPGWVRPVFVRLIEIQRAVSEWVPTSGRQPVWASKITPEHEQRRRLCEFVDLDGTTQVFDMHARFTPGVGRIYFRLNGAGGTARIAHIGRKLGA